MLNNLKRKRVIILKSAEDTPVVVDLPWSVIEIENIIPDYTSAYNCVPKKNYSRDIVFYINWGSNRHFADNENFPRETTNLFGVNGPIIIAKAPYGGDPISLTCNEIAKIFDDIMRRQIKRTFRKKAKETEG